MLMDIWCGKRWGVLFSAVFGALCAAAVMALFSALSCFLLETAAFVRGMSVISLAAGGLAGGHSCGKLRRRKGLAEGLAVGALMYSMLAAAALIISGQIPALSKLALLALSGAVGGIYGVNSKCLSRRYYSQQRR